MAFKVVLFLFRKPSLSSAQFKDIYETSHVPLVKSLTGELFPLSHTRRYLAEKDLAGATHFDAIAEMTFADRDAFVAFSTRLMEGENGKKVTADCEQFLDAAKTDMRVVEEFKESTRDE